MARYKKHSIAYGETLQSIAQLHMGDVNRWTDIAEYNGLSYPYIVDTVEEKKSNLEQLVTIGDTIIIPIDSLLESIQPESLTNQDRQRIMELSFGKDLSMTHFEDRFMHKGTSDEILELSGNNKGDILTVLGVDNIKQALQAKLLTPKGALLLHPEYGSNLHKLFGKATIEQAKLIEIDVCRTMLTDKRVANVQLLNFEIEGSTYRGEYEVELISFEEAFKFVLQGDATGMTILA